MQKKRFQLKIRNWHSQPTTAHLYNFIFNARPFHLVHASINTYMKKQIQQKLLKMWFMFAVKVYFSSLSPTFYSSWSFVKNAKKYLVKLRNYAGKRADLWSIPEELWNFLMCKLRIFTSFATWLDRQNLNSLFFGSKGICSKNYSNRLSCSFATNFMLAFWFFLCF